VKVPFDLLQPNIKQKLPDQLYEISGITWFDNYLACIEDEHGRLYLYDITSDEIVSDFKFAKKGDFEGVEVINGIFYAIESNGDLHKFMLESEDSDIIDTPFSGKNDVEGLGKFGGDLLVACKARGEIDGIETKNKAIYRLDPTRPEDPELLLEISVDELRDYVAATGRTWKVHQFDPSGVAYDEQGTLLYVLSADQYLVVTKLDGSLVEVVRLDPKQFRQPEGICFDDKGSLYLSSEGAGAPARIYRFDRN
jgi:uncharacterized protein YjiK